VYLNDMQPVVDCEIDATDGGPTLRLREGAAPRAVPASAGEMMFTSRTTRVPDGSRLVTVVTWGVGLALGTWTALSGIINATRPV
jgi:hypothetical protein